MFYAKNKTINNLFNKTLKISEKNKISEDLKSAIFLEKYKNYLINMISISLSSMVSHFNHEIA